MRTGLVISLSLVLAACGGAPDSYDPASDNHGYGYHYDVQGPRGLQLRYERPSDASLFAVSTFEEMFDEVQRCTGLSAPMPFVILVPWEDLQATPAGQSTGFSIAGVYHSNPSLIVTVTPPGIAQPYRFFKHEAVHYLCHVNLGNSACSTTGAPNPDERHRSPFFTSCIT